MIGPKRKPPPWLDTSQPQNDRARTQLCPRCRQPILRALVGHVAALDVRADPTPLDLAQEVAARLQGRTTYCLRVHPHLPARLIHRGPEHIRAGRCTHLVVADHHCPRTPAPAEPHTTADRLF
ncbi:hypothetical protein [Streptomyces luteocolor]|uniref:hypothetical protein n=1 Tax=Streptomyces luteocolor TaxID=285500 RepID=UPI00085349E5|nr:hypothetical protein [Streptomyces luteocolor]